MRFTPRGVQTHAHGFEHTGRGPPGETLELEVKEEITDTGPFDPGIPLPMTEEPAETPRLRPLAPNPPLRDGAALLRTWISDDTPQLCEALQDPESSKWIEIRTSDVDFESCDPVHLARNSRRISLGLTIRSPSIRTLAK